MDMDRRDDMPGLEQAPIEMEMDVKPIGLNSGMVEEKRREKEERRKADVKQKDCFTFGSGEGSESEVEQQDRQRQIDQWNLKRPSIMEPLPDGEKRHRNT